MIIAEDHRLILKFFVPRRMLITKYKNPFTKSFIR